MLLRKIESIPVSMAIQMASALEELMLPLSTMLVTLTAWAIFYGSYRLSLPTI